MKEQSIDSMDALRILLRQFWYEIIWILYDIENDMGIRLLHARESQHAFDDTTEFVSILANDPSDRIAFSRDVEYRNDIVYLFDPILDVQKVTLHIYVDDGHELITQLEIVHICPISLYDPLFLEILDPLDQSRGVYS
jgi:hypothetical protein